MFSFDLETVMVLMRCVSICK